MKPVTPKPAVARKPRTARIKASEAVVAPIEAAVETQAEIVAETVETSAKIATETVEAAAEAVMSPPPEPVIAPVVRKSAKTAAKTVEAAAEAMTSPMPVVSPADLIPPVSKKKVFQMTAMPTAPFKGYEEFTAFSKANMDAFIQASQLFAKGIEEMSKEMMSLTQSSMESAAAAAKAVFAAKTFKDVVDLNTTYTKTSFDKFVANSTKLSEMGVKITTDAMAPMTARVNVAVEKIMRPSA